MTKDFSGYLPHLHLVDGVDLPTYFIVVSLTLCLCTVWLMKRAERQGFARNAALDLSVVMMLAGFIGSRLLHMFFEAPSYYAENPGRVFEVWRGGFVWYGGALGAAIAGIAYLRHRAFNVWRWLDLLAPVIALGYGLGRSACVLTGCCFGAVCSLSSGAQFRYPTQAFAVFWELAVLAGLLLFEKRRAEKRVPPRWRQYGQIFFVWLALHGTGRLVMETFRGDDRGPGVMGFSLSMWISLCLILTAAAFLWHSRRIKPHSSIAL
jgi:phosphatidylglycerol:prolipoprotein diacylglycerol transferase